MMPNAKILACSKAPPENILKKPNKVPSKLLKALLSSTRLTPGIATKDTSAINRQQRRSKKNPVTEFGDLANVPETRCHDAYSRGRNKRDDPLFREF